MAWNLVCLSLRSLFYFLTNEAYILMTYLSDSAYVRPVELVFQGFKVLLLCLLSTVVKTVLKWQLWQVLWQMLQDPVLYCLFKKQSILLFGYSFGYSTSSPVSLVEKDGITPHNCFLCQHWCSFPVLLSTQCTLSARMPWAPVMKYLLERNLLGT